MGLSGLPQNMKHESCKLCYSQQVLTSDKPRKEPLCELPITRAYTTSSWNGFKFVFDLLSLLSNVTIHPTSLISYSYTTHLDLSALRKLHLY